jgi:hypothetical protein
MASWRARKADWDFCSETRLRATVMSTILPDEMFGGRRIEGNSICIVHQFIFMCKVEFKVFVVNIRAFCPGLAGRQRPHQPCRLSR